MYNEEVAEARADGKPADPHNASDLMEEKSSFVSDELTEREKKYDLNSAENMSPHPLISLAQWPIPHKVKEVAVSSELEITLLKGIIRAQSNSSTSRISLTLG